MSKQPTENEIKELAKQNELKKKKQNEETAQNESQLERQKQQMQNQQLTESQQLQSSNQPKWASDLKKGEMKMKGPLKEITEEDLKKAGLNPKHFQKTANGFKFKLDDKRTIDVDGNVIRINDYSENTFGAVAKLAASMKSKELNMSPLAKDLNGKPEKEKILFNAFKAAKTNTPPVDVVGLGNDSNGKDLLQKFEAKLKDELKLNSTPIPIKK